MTTEDDDNEVLKLLDEVDAPLRAEVAESITNYLDRYLRQLRLDQAKARHDRRELLWKIQIQKHMPELAAAHSAVADTDHLIEILETALKGGQSE